MAVSCCELQGPEQVRCPCRRPAAGPGAEGRERREGRQLLNRHSLSQRRRCISTCRLGSSKAFKHSAPLEISAGATAGWQRRRVMVQPGRRGVCRRCPASSPAALCQGCSFPAAKGGHLGEQNQQKQPHPTLGNGERCWANAPASSLA